MKVDSFTLSGDLYGYENTSNTVLKSDYGVFLFTGENRLGQFEGRIRPYQVDFHTGEKLIEQNAEIDVYISEEDILFPVYSLADVEPTAYFVLDGEQFIRTGSFVETRPQEIAGPGEYEATQLVEVYTGSVPRNSGHPQLHAEYVELSVLQDIFYEMDVVRVVPEWEP